MCKCLNIIACIVICVCCIIHGEICPLNMIYFIYMHLSRVSRWKASTCYSYYQNLHFYSLKQYYNCTFFYQITTYLVLAVIAAVFTIGIFGSVAAGFANDKREMREKHYAYYWYNSYHPTRSYGYKADEIPPSEDLHINPLSSTTVHGYEIVTSLSTATEHDIYHGRYPTHAPPDRSIWYHYVSEYPCCIVRVPLVHSRLLVCCKHLCSEYQVSGVLSPASITNHLTPLSQASTNRSATTQEHKIVQVLRST